MLESFPPRDDADAKAWFYLDRRRDIEERAGLRSDAAELFDRYLIAQAADFERRAVFHALADVRSALSGSAGRDWPFWRYVRPAVGAGSVDPAELARSGLQKCRNLWAAAAPILDAHR